MDEEEQPRYRELTVRKTSASMTYEGQASAAMEQSMSEIQSRSFRADTRHQDPQVAQTLFAQQSEQSIFEI